MSPAAAAGRASGRRVARACAWLAVAAACIAAPLASPLAAGAVGAGATAAAPNPAANIPIGPLPQSCDRAPTGAACEGVAIARLNSARAKLGLGPYLLPKGFVALSPARQWLILANLDRIAYARRPIRGLTLQLDASARQGAQAREDPDPSSLVSGLPGQSQIAFASNWAGGQGNALLAYYGWMYDDGYGSVNLDCSSPTAPGCWGHRQDVLAFPSGPALSMGGAAIVHGEPSYAMTIVATSTPPWPYSYTWAKARADGAGR
jgi:hypothetical protein